MNTMGISLFSSRITQVNIFVLLILTVVKKKIFIENTNLLFNGNQISEKKIHAFWYNEGNTLGMCVNMHVTSL